MVSGPVGLSVRLQRLCYVAGKIGWEERGSYCFFLQAKTASADGKDVPLSSPELQDNGGPTAALGDSRKLDERTRPWMGTGMPRSDTLFLAFILVALSHAPGHGDELPEPSFFPRYDHHTWPTFSTPAAREDWFDFKAEVDVDKGLLGRLAPCHRQQLADNGINVFGWYMMAFQGNAIGGVDKKFEATGLNDFGIDLNLEKMAGLKGLSVRTSGSWAWGPNLTDEVGATIPVNAVFSGTAWRFFEMYFEQWMLDDTVSLRAGRLGPPRTYLSGRAPMCLVTVRCFIRISCGIAPPRVYSQMLLNRTGRAG